jgi:hypothetical protein
MGRYTGLKVREGWPRVAGTRRAAACSRHLTVVFLGAPARTLAHRVSFFGMARSNHAGQASE